LSFNTCKQYDLIVMNPDFRYGENHLLKAIEMQSNGGGKIVCLLNAATIKHPDTNIRKDLQRKLTENNAQIEYIESAFSDAERKTDVEIAMVKINIPKKIKTSEFYKKLKSEQDFKREEAEKSEVFSIVENDFIKVIIDQYNLEIKLGIKLIEEYIGMEPYIMSTLGNTSIYNKPILKLDFPDTGNYTENLNVNEFIRRVRSKYWSALFGNSKFTELLTTNLRSEYQSQIGELCEYDFSEYNILSIKLDMSKKMISGVEDTIVKLFEEFSYKHYYDESAKNIHYYNGWKSNKCWFINNRIIIPLSAYSQWDGRLECSSYSVKEKLTDIERVFNYLDGGITEYINLTEMLAQSEKSGQTKKIKLKYFDVTFYKKGTTHIEFTNLELLKKFNIFGSQKKNWLPPSYGKKTYGDMSAEEQKVIDEFEGEENYKKVINNKNYYITESSKLIMLENNMGGIAV